MPKNLESLSLKFDQGFRTAMIVVYENFSKFIAQSFTIRSLKLDSFSMINDSVDKIFADMFLDNKSIRKLTILNFTNTYYTGP